MGRTRNRVVYRVGDVSPEEYGGGALMQCGSYFVLEYTFGAETDQRERCPENETVIAVRDLVGSE